MRHVNEIIVHATATRPEWWADKPTSAKVAEIRRWHLERGFNDIGYHFLIDRDGTVSKGRPIEKTGAHVKGHNTGSIGVSLFGGFGGVKDGKFSDSYTPAQEIALRELLTMLQTAHPTINKISGHSKYANKACPCFDVADWLLERKPRKLTQSTTIQAAGAAGLSGVVGVGTAIAQLDKTAQTIVIVAAVIAACCLAWVAKERIKKWGRGIK